MVERGVLGFPKHNLAPSSKNKRRDICLSALHAQGCRPQFSQFAPKIKAATLKNKVTDTNYLVIEVCKGQGDNIQCATCQV